MPKYDITLELPSNETRGSVDLEGVELDSTDPDQAASEFIAYLADNMSIDKVQNTYRVMLSLRLDFEFDVEDVDGEYDDEGDLGAAIEGGSFDFGDYVNTGDGSIEDVIEVEVDTL